MGSYIETKKVVDSEKNVFFLEIWIQIVKFYGVYRQNWLYSTTICILIVTNHFIMEAVTQAVVNRIRR